MARLFAALGFIASIVMMPAAAARAEEPPPRFASLRNGEANLRAGPGTRYPIHWVYRRRAMPVEITDSYGNWRKIRDVDGVEGWLHHGLLSGTRTALVRGNTHMLRRNPAPDSSPILKAEPMVIGTLLQCGRDWCRVEISDHAGWMEKTALWGVYADEKF